MSEAFIYDTVRTPRGRVKRGGGTLAGVPSYELLAQLLRELGTRGLPAERVDDVIIGVNTPAAEQATDLARVAIMAAEWPDTVPAGIVSRMCCSGLDAIASASAQVRSGQADLLVAGGAESLSRVPMFSDKPTLATDAELGELTGFVTIGVSADLTAAQHGFSREELDAYAVQSHLRAAAAPAWESIVPVRVDGEVILRTDEGARPDTTAEGLAALAPLFGDDPLWARVEARFPGFSRPSAGLHTVATAPQLSDAASAIVIGSAEAGRSMGREPLGRVVSWAHTAARSPRLDGAAEAARRALAKAGIGIQDVRVAEFNESFSVTPLLLMRELGISADKVNVHGGGVSVGHPLGATGGILLANAMDLLRRSGGGYGLLVIPAALGVSMAVVVESF